MPASVFNGNAVKILKDLLRFKSGAELASTDAANLAGTTGNVQSQIDAVVADVAAIPDPLTYQGTWDASTNTPTLANTDTGVAGYIYQVNGAGSVNFGAGSISFEVGDKVVNNGTVWEKWDMTDSVSSVNGQTGAVTLTKSDVGLSNVDNTSDATKNAAVATLTNKTLTSPVINSPTGIVKADVGLGNVDNTSDATKNAAAVSLTNKTIDADLNTITNIENADIKAGAGIALNKLAASTASRAAAYDSSGFLTAAATTAAELDFVAGARSVLQTQIDGQAANNARNLNWITNYGAEVNATGYNAYADAASTSPVDGTGGSPACTIARSTTTPLDGAADLNFVKDAANRQGEGFSYDFTIDRAYQGTIQQIAFNYEVISGTYASGDMTVWVYDVTNAVLLPQPSGNSIISTSVPSQQGQCTFQTSINSTSYRLIFHVSTTSASAYTLAFDNISVGPQVTSTGGPVVDLGTETWTDNQANATTSVTLYRNGSILRAVGLTTFSGASSGQFTITIPSQYTPIYTDYTNNKNYSVGRGKAIDSGSAVYDGDCVTTATNSMQLYLTGTGATYASQSNTSATAPFTWASGDSFNFDVSWPVVGWQSSTVMSTSANTRPVVFYGTGTGISITANVTNIPFTSVKDSVSAWTGSTYVVAVPGDYRVSFSGSAAAVTGIDFYKNNSSYRTGDQVANTNYRASASIIYTNLVVGDIISIRGDVTTTVNNAQLSIDLLQSPQQIAASESINARYYASATSISGSLATIVWSTKDYDSHNSMSSGVYTCPAPGKYRVVAQLTLSATFVLNNVNTIQIQKNGAAVSDATEYVAAAVTNYIIDIDDVISCNAGDQIRVQLSSGGTTPAIVSSNTKNFITINREGQ